MKEIKLQKLVLENFKGFTFALDPNGLDVNVFGRNATGKTTLADAFSWLLFGKDSLGRADFEIKNLDGAGNSEHGLDHSVEGFFTINDTPIILKRVYHEIWSKKRGSATKTFTGHTTDHFIDGVPVKENEYKAKILELAGDESVFRMLTSPTVFPSLPWQKQRSLLLEICGDITDQQVIETDDNLLPLIDLLKRFTVSKTPLDDLRKVVTSRRTEINKHMDQLPVRIDEVNKGLPDITGLVQGDIKAQMACYDVKLEELKLKLSGIDNGSNIADLSKRLSALNADIRKLEESYTDEVNASVKKLNQKIEAVQEEKSLHDRKSKNLIESIAFRKDALPGLEKKLQALREKWAAVDAEAFQDSTETICPACGQSLPANRVEEARDKALAAFNRSKAERLGEIEEEGKRIAGQKDTIVIDIEKLNKELIELPAFESVYNLEELTAERDNIKSLAYDFSKIPNHADLVNQRKGIEAEIEKAKGSVSVDREAITEEISAINGLLVDEKAKLDKFTRREQGEQRIKELKAEEKKLSAEFEELEKQLFLIESFIKRKVSLLTDRINNQFSLVKWKLYDIQVNQGLSECCVATVAGIPYDSGLNSAGKTQAGCDIINTLQDHFQLIAPMFCDNRESVTELPNMRCQVISLYVSPEDERLRIEASTKSRKAA